MSSIKSQLQRQMVKNQKRHREAHQKIDLEETETFKVIKINKIETNPFQPRLFFSQESIDVLAKSIEMEGMFQPIVVRPNGVRGFQLVCGERRLRACVQLGLTEIKAMISPKSDLESARSALEENLIRENLSDFEVAESIHKIYLMMCEKEGAEVSKSELATACQLSRPALYRYLSFSHLPDYVRLRLKKNPKVLSGTVAQKLEKFLKESLKESGGDDESLAQQEEVVLEILDRVEGGELSQGKIVSELERVLCLDEECEDDLKDAEGQVEVSDESKRGSERLNQKSPSTAATASASASTSSLSTSSPSASPQEKTKKGERSTDFNGLTKSFNRRGRRVGSIRVEDGQVKIHMDTQAFSYEQINEVREMIDGFLKKKRR